jgi:hypothetical protein
MHLAPSVCVVLAFLCNIVIAIVAFLPVALVYNSRHWPLLPHPKACGC